MERETCENLLKRYGAILSKTVGKKMDYAVVGTDAGPKKLELLAEYKIPILSEDQLLDMLRTLPAKKGIDSSEAPPEKPLAAAKPGTPAASKAKVIKTKKLADLPQVASTVKEVVALNPIAPIPIAVHVQHIPMAVDAHEAHEPAGLNIVDEVHIRDAAGSAAAAALAEQESADARAEASDSELLTAENVEAEAAAIVVHETTFAVAGTGQNVHQRRVNARIARMPVYLQEFEIRRRQ